jgi:NADH dehydrogenase
MNPKVIIIGAGFGGLEAATALAKQPVDVLLIDKNNYHTFTPLIYQVATCALDPSEVAYPVRGIFRGIRNVSFLLGMVTAIDTQLQQVAVEHDGEIRTESYDYLIVAGGSVYNFFGMDAVAKRSFVLSELSDAVRLRNHVLRMFEKAVWEEDGAERDALTTIVVIGGGPTGIETAGAIYELYNHVLTHEFSQRQLRARVVLVEMQQHLLSPYPHKLQHAALTQLRSLGVEVILGNGLTAVSADNVTLSDGTILPTHTLVWSAGVKASPLADLLGIPLAKMGRVPIDATTAVRGLANVYVIGDMSYLEDANGEPYPMLIPVAQQQAKIAAHNIMAMSTGGKLKQFVYNDRGIMATIGRKRAVAWLFNRVTLKGRIAWFAWLFLHLVTLVGFRNRLNVFVNWTWNYFTFDRSARLLLEQQPRIAKE